MMAKMGHVEGKGLGAKQDGIITPLQQQQTKQQFLGQNSKAQTEKRKRGQGEQGSRPVKRPAMGRIVGGKKAKGTEDDDEPYGPMSAVVVVFGFLKGVDLEADNNRDDGGIRQEIGEACGAKVRHPSLLMGLC
jgi:splicing factor 45